MEADDVIVLVAVGVFVLLVAAELIELEVGGGLEHVDIDAVGVIVRKVAGVLLVVLVLGALQREGVAAAHHVALALQVVDRLDFEVRVLAVLLLKLALIHYSSCSQSFSNASWFGLWLTMREEYTCFSWISWP